MAPAEFDRVLLDPTRLTIVSLLASAQWAEFGWVKDSAGLTPSALSKQITTLESHGYVEVRKGYVGKRPRTWVSLSDAGRAALEAHAAALQQIVQDSRRTRGESLRPETPPARPEPTAGETGG